MRRHLSILILALLAAGPAAARGAADVPLHAHYVRLDAREASKLEPLGLVPYRAIDYGSFLWLTLDTEALDRLRRSSIPFQEEENAFTLDLGGVSFDPLAGEPAHPPDLARGAAAGPDLQLVQFAGPVRAEWLEGLRAAGLEIVQYIHPYTYVVWGEGEDLERAAARPEVRWTGPFAPAFRLQPRFRGLADRTEEVRAMLYRGADSDAALRQIERLGGEITGREPIDAIFEIATFRISAARLAGVSRVPGVYSLRPAPKGGGLRGEMSAQVCADNVNGSNQAFPGYTSWLGARGIDGTGVKIADVDGGIQNSHPDLAGRLQPCSGTTCGGSTTDSHGTHTAGLMAADGSSGATDGYGFLRGLGVAPGAGLIEQLYYPYYTYANGMLLLMSDSYSNGASLSGNSWGPSGYPLGYDDDTRQVDIGVRDAVSGTAGNQPLSFVLSIMNGYGGTSSQGTPDEAKNIFTVGSTKMQNSSGSQILQIDDLSSNSAHGPALDGRRIPHLVAPGCSVDSTVPTSSYGVSGWCGTSMASPHVSGAVALFIDYYRGLPGYAADPSPALVKAAFLPVAHDLAGHLDADGAALGHPFDSKQGWGRLDLEPVLNPPLPVRYWDNPQLLNNTGEEWTATISAADPGQPLRLMLVWTDAPGHGLGGSTPAWNNNLDLVVEEGASTYRGNVFGASGWSVAGGTADPRNNTEGIFLGPTAPGSYTVRVLAGNIGSDGVPGTGDATDQDFSLVCYNCAEGSGPTVGASLSCLPPLGTVPFTAVISATLTNNEATETRRIAGRIDATLAGGQSFPNWRSGYTNVAPGGSYVTTWNQNFPAIGSVVGLNGFQLTAEDVTPSPFNQPPYAPSGDTGTDGCVVVGVAP